MRTVLLTLLILLTGLPAKAQQPNPVYDSVLAARLGADERGMRMYVLVILKTGPGDKLITAKPVRDSLFKGHMANIKRLASEHLLSVAGPFEANRLSYRGLFIFNVATVGEARKLIETDPTVKAGIFDYELLPWYGSASLLETGEIHRKISRSF